MTDRPLGTPQSASAPSDDPTRDVRLPPLSEHPPASVAPAPPARPGGPSCWTGSRRRTPPLEPDRSRLPSRSASSARRAGRPDLGGGRPRARAPAEAPPPPAAVAPGPPARSGGRPWTWVLLAVLPIVVIAVAGVLLYLLLGGG